MFLNIVSYLIIPLYTILFARNTDWLATNFSVIGNLDSKKNAFLVWGILVGAYFYHIITKILLHVPRHKKESMLSAAALLFLSLAVMTPYLPESLPFQSLFHVIFAFSSAVVLLLCLCLTISKLYRLDRFLYQPYVIGLICISLVSLFLLLAAGIVSSALEIFFTISCVVMTRLLYKRVLLRDTFR